jgi:ABC-type molybdate transport system substrate-binding protein
MFNKKMFCNSRFRWIAIAIAIITACASGNHKAEAATSITVVAQGSTYEYRSH